MVTRVSDMPVVYLTHKRGEALMTGVMVMYNIISLHGFIGFRCQEKPNRFQNFLRGPLTIDSGRIVCVCAGCGSSGG